MVDNILNKKIGFPKWFVILMVVDYAIVMPILLVYTFFSIYNNKGISIFSFFLLVFLFLAAWLFKYLFYSVTATSDGLVTDNKFGRNKSIPWSDIIEVRRPRFQIPYEFTSVISKNGDKLYLLKSMTYYKELIELIRERAQNLKECKY